MNGARTIIAVMLMALGLGAEASYEDALSAWANVLASYVDPHGRTDFRALAQDRGDLDRFVAALAQDGPRTNPDAFSSRDEILAFHLNAYNAMAMQGVIDKDVPQDFDSFFKRVRFFKFRKIVVDGDQTNLYDYENEVIRPLGDARIHFALNCMVKDCPRLPQAPFLAPTVDAQLTKLAREFFASEKHIRLDASKQALWVSEILDFYTEDFAASELDTELITYINQFRENKIPTNWRVRFIDYDWTINQQR